MHRKILIAALAVLAVALVASPAFAKAPHRYSPKPGHACKKSYRQVKHHGKRFCVKRSAKKKTAPKAADKVKLHAHLDPTFTRDPLNPFKVTYAYSASATQEAVASPAFASASAEGPAPLPAGVLALYSDGKLECAVNVGSGVEGSECPVSYPTLGEHRVTTIYSSGEQSATETEVENITPLATTTTLTVSYSPLARTQSDFGCGEGSACEVEEGWHENGGFNVGTLSVHASTSLPGAIPVASCSGGEANCRSLPLNGTGDATFPAAVIANYTALEEKPVGLGDTLAIEPEPIKSVTLQGLPSFSQAPLAEVVEGSIYFRVAAPPRDGYQSSVATAAIQFSPQVTSPVERIALG